ncbi:MAG TPA: hypothetical protein VMH04_06700 [Candidatus Solibacter sp.]|nr:hypothetical protein [Candidatus Solibacter sp.]
MASLRQHMDDCQRFLGEPYEKVHRWIDEFYTQAGPKHRRFRHHWEGVGEVEKLFGPEAAKAAIVHILRDCRNVPKAEDYESGAADVLGLKSAWPVSAYIRYPEEAFATLVKYTLEGPMAMVLWAFFRSKPDIANFLTGVSRLTPDQQNEYLERWEAANSRWLELNQTTMPGSSVRDVEGPTYEYFKEATSVIGSLLDQFPRCRFVMAPVEQLITPLTLIDYEYVEQLKATLVNTEPRHVAEFALPKQINVEARAAVDASGKSVHFISSEKSLAATPLSIMPIPGVGFEIKTAVIGTPQLILVSRVADRLYLRSGIHRAYLLASLGIKEIPCLLTEDAQIPLVTAIYPSFAPHVLALQRPPLLMDAFDPNLTLLVPIARTGKIIRISIEELILPFE